MIKQKIAPLTDIMAPAFKILSKILPMIKQLWLIASNNVCNVILYKLGFFEKKSSLAFKNTV